MKRATLNDIHRIRSTWPTDHDTQLLLDFVAQLQSVIDNYGDRNTIAAAQARGLLG